MTEWPGHFYDGVTVGKRPVTIRLEPGGVHIAVADVDRHVWPTGELRLGRGGVSGSLVTLEHGADPVQAVVVDTPGFADALHASYPELVSRAPSAGATARLLWLAVAATALLALALVFAAPAGATWAATRVPPEWEAELGKQVVASMAPADRRCDASAGNADVRAVLDRLLAAAPPSPYRFELYVVRDTVVNAFAAPGGFVVINAGLLRAARSPEELAGVLAHEIQHVLQRHSTRGILRDAPLRLLIGAAFGGTSVEALASMAGALGSLGYRRSDETEADQEGLRLMVAAGVDPAGMVSFMQLLAERSRGPRAISYLTSHPHSADRVAALQAMTSAARGPWRPLLSPDAWERARRLCD